MQPLDVGHRLGGVVAREARPGAGAPRGEAECEQEAWRAERDEAIREAYAAELPVRDIAGIVDVSHQHVSRIVRDRNA